MYTLKWLGIYYIHNSYSYTATPVVTNILLLPAQNIVFGHQLNLSCISSGSPPDTFIWMKDGVPITNSSSITELNYTNTTAVFSTSYTISNLSIDDTGAYICTVFNPIGRDNKTINVLSGKLLM